MLRPYRGRLAPSPTGYLHLGHAKTFAICVQRAREAGGELILRMEDLDPKRWKPEYIQAVYDDFEWMGLPWSEGPDIGGPYGPYMQSERRESYLDAWNRLKAQGSIYPCLRSRKDVREAAGAPHEEHGPQEKLFPPAWRAPPEAAETYASPEGANWRFRVPDGEKIQFNDALQGPQCFVAGKDFGDFVVWRKDDLPAYELAVIVDDAAMHITEVVRGRDLLLSTARQLLLYRALNETPPDFAHTELVRDAEGERLAKRHQSLSLKHLRESGRSFAECIAEV